VAGEYGEDLAHIHDTGHGDFALGAAPGLLRILRRHGVRGGLVVDLGCGSGQWPGELARAGYQVLGIDWSGPMLELARRRAPSARFVRRSFFDFELPPCDAVTSIGESLNYRFDSRAGLPELERLFGRVRAALRPGGVLAFDALEPGEARARGPARRWSAGEGWAVLIEASEDRAARELTRRLSIFRRQGDLYRRTDEVHRQLLYPRAEMIGALERAGFEARAVGGYGRFRLARGHSAYIARSPIPEHLF
jgi:SAM-dependent methyltransferase